MSIARFLGDVWVNVSGYRGLRANKLTISIPPTSSNPRSAALSVPLSVDEGIDNAGFEGYKKLDMKHQQRSQTT